MAFSNERLSPDLIGLEIGSREGARQNKNSEIRSPAQPDPDRLQIYRRGLRFRRGILLAVGALAGDFSAWQLTSAAKRRYSAWVGRCFFCNCQFDVSLWI
jgi:hypothetical protein